LALAFPPFPLLCFPLLAIELPFWRPGERHSTG
jgi:hypothetical protein